jgi:hypothetical protein
MTSFEHSSDYFRLKEKIDNSNSLPDLIRLSEKLRKIEASEEVQELICLCESRIDELKIEVNEQKYQQISTPSILDSADIDSLIKICEDLGNYKNSRAILELLKKEKKYRDALSGMKRIPPSEWHSLLLEFKELGEYKDSKQLLQKCTTIYEDACEKQYQEAVAAEKRNPTEAISLYSNLGDYKDSSTRKIKLENKLKRRHRRRNVLIFFIVIILILVATYAVLKGQGVIRGISFSDVSLWFQQQWNKITDFLRSITASR